MPLTLLASLFSVTHSPSLSTMKPPATTSLTTHLSSTNTINTSHSPFNNLVPVQPFLLHRPIIFLTTNHRPPLQ
ncbi:hypothetical protein LguiB_011843 [Lonicera macranthoides]